MNRADRSVWSSASVFVGLMLFLQPASATEKREPVGAFIVDSINDVFGTHSKPAVAELRPKVIPPSGGKMLDPTKFYLVSLKCRSSPDTAKLLSEGLVVEERTFIAQTLWISKSAGNGAIPTDATKVVTAFSFEKDKEGTIQDFKNNTCSQTFLLSGKSPVLSVSFSLTDAKKASFASTLLYSAAKMLTGIAPALFAGPFATAITTKAKAAQDTQDPLTAVISAMNTEPRRSTLATNIRVGSRPTVITTGYSRIEMKVTEVSDVAAVILSSKILQQSFYDTFDAISADALKDITGANLRDKCAKFANTLAKHYSFNRKDSSFIFGYVAQDAFPADVNQRLDCIGNKYNAKDIVDFAFPYNRDYISLRKLTLADINKRFDHTPLGSPFARSYANGLANLLSVYSQSDGDQSRKEEASTALLKQISNPVHLEDESKTITILDVDVTPEQLLTKLNDAGYRRFGCFFLKPTVGAGSFDMILLALPEKAATNGIYEIDELLGLRLLVDVADKATDSGLLKTVQITNDDLALMEAANENKGKCKGGAKINIGGK